VSPLAWWIIPIGTTVAAALWTQFGGTRIGGLPPRPEPGSQADRADLIRFEAALRQPLPWRVDSAGDGALAARDE
jgi:hypothetical protein